MRVLLCLLIVSTRLTGAEDVCAEIRALVAAEVQRQKVPAMSVAARQRNQTVCSVATGFADLEQHVPNTPTSLHRLASLSKPVAAVITMKLVEEKQLALEDSVRKFLPELPERYEAVTVRRLLSHQSGLREYANDEEVFSTRHYPDLRSALAIFIDSPLLFAPGAKTAYTTYGYTLLGAVLERVTGRLYPALVHQFASEFKVDDFLALVPERVRPYRKKADGSGWENAPAFDASNKYPGGGLLASAEQYLAFLTSVNAGRVLKPETVAEMWTLQKLTDGTVVPYATLGWATGVKDGQRFVTHGGLQPGSTTTMRFYPATGVGSVILCNAEGVELDTLQDKILALLLRG